MNSCLRSLCLSALALIPELRADDISVKKLPFEPTVISRQSLDDIPRSMAIRQGTHVWLGYDLERATPFKVWQSPVGKPGLLVRGFVTRSDGASFFEDKSSQGWELQRQEATLPVLIRFLSCSHRSDFCELKWELQNASNKLELHERIALGEPSVGYRAMRELQVHGLEDHEALLPPLAVRSAWKLLTREAEEKPVLSGSHWHTWVLP